MPGKELKKIKKTLKKPLTELMQIKWVFRVDKVISFDFCFNHFCTGNDTLANPGTKTPKYPFESLHSTSIIIHGPQIQIFSLAQINCLYQMCRKKQDFPKNIS